jgi:deoxyribonuclease-4
MAVMKFGTVGSPISTPAKPGGSIGAIQQISVLGLNAFELAWVQSVRVSEQTCELIKQTGLENNVSLSVHAPYYINLNAEDAEWPKSRKRLLDAAYFGFLAGATDIIFHPGSYFKTDRRTVLKKVIPRLQDLVNELQSKGVQVTLRPETMGKSAMIGSLEDLMVICKECETVLPCMDFAHLHARNGDGSNNSEKEWNYVLELYSESLGKEALKKLHIHLSGIEYSEKGERRHLPLSEADLDVRALFKSLKNHAADGRIMCESPILEEDALLMQRTWQTL